MEHPRSFFLEPKLFVYFSPVKLMKFQNNLWLQVEALKGEFCYQRGDLQTRTSVIVKMVRIFEFWIQHIFEEAYAESIGKEIAHTCRVVDVHPNVEEFDHNW